MREDGGEAAAKISRFRPAFEDDTSKTLLLRAAEAWTSRDGNQTRLALVIFNRQSIGTKSGVSHLTCDLPYYTQNHNDITCR